MDPVVSAARKNPPRVVDAQNLEPTVLGIGGALLLGLAAYFAWKELRLANEVLMLAATGGAAVLAAFAAKKGLAIIGPLALTATTLGAGVWYSMTKEPLLVTAMGVGFVASVAATLYAQKTFSREHGQVHLTFSWLGTAITGLATTFATYFLVFDATETGLNDFIARRAVLTLTWLISGTALVLAGRRRKASEIRDAGFVVLAASMGKLLLYDMARTDGMVRIATLVISGVVLMGASRVIGLLNRGKAA